MNPETTEVDDVGDEDIVLPRRSVDPDETLEDRLTANIRTRAGPERYFLRDGRGDLIEDGWDDVFERVAQNVAMAEAVFADKPISISIRSDAVADWVSDEDKAELFDVENGDGIGLEKITDDGKSYVHDNEIHRRLDEELVSYLEYDGLLERLPDDVAETVEKTAAQFEDLMRTQQFMPNSPTLMNAGSEVQQLSACFVDSPEDSIESLNQTESEWTLIQKTGGGIGGAFHKLRPKGHPISTTGGVSSGPLSFMTKYDLVAGVIKQGGKRRGAQMGIMHSQHPDIGRFVVSKRTEDGLTNFNISAAFSDEFIEAIEHEETYELKFPIDSDEPYEVTPEVAHFYDPDFEDAWNEDFDKPATGYDGIAVEENFWRDYLPDMQDPDAFDQYREYFEPETKTVWVHDESGEQMDEKPRVDNAEEQWSQEEVTGPRPLEPGQDLELPAGFVFQMIIDGAHNNGEPGFVHYDEINREHSFDTEENPERTIEATNPCAEQPLQKYEACNLGHINLSLVADEDAQTWLEYSAENDDATMREYLDMALDTEQLTEIGELGTRFLDNVVTMSKFPLEEIEDRVRNMRKIGLGLMGFHQLLLQLGIEYGTEESEAAAEDIMRRIDTTATLQSQHLAEERGVFGEYEDSKWSELDKHPEWSRTHAHVDPDEVDGSMKVRNHNMTTIAPTGTTSMIGDTSAGCEPIYSVAFFKNVGDDIQGEEMLVEFDEYFLRVLEANDIDVEAVKAEATEQMMESEFDGIDSLDRVPDTIGDLFVTTDDLALEDHIGVQSAFQVYCDSGISKTLNAPNETTIEEVGDAYIQALGVGVKGATVYRDGSRDEQVKTTRATGNNLDEADVVDAEVVAELLVRGELGAQLDLWDLVDEGMIDAETLESLEEHGAPIEIEEPAE